MCPACRRRPVRFRQPHSSVGACVATAVACRIEFLLVVCSHPVLQYAQGSCTIPATPQRQGTCAGCHLLKPASRLARTRLTPFGLPAAGFLYDIGDYAAATVHVRRLVEDAALRQQMGREARLEVGLFRGRPIFCDVLPNTALLSSSWQHDLQAVPCM